MASALGRLMIFVCCVLATTTWAICPAKCTCKSVSENASTLKVKCGGMANNKITSVKELQFGDDCDKVLHLDLSKNQISHIEEADFANFTNLKRLDLSHNSLQQIDESMFGEIVSLERLRLSTNIIVHIFQGSFEKLKALKQLDISGNPLACDCDLLWLVGWSNNMSVKLQPPPKCESPSDFKGSVLKKLKVGSDLHCESPLQPLLELHPDKDQLVFEGDELVLRCRAPRVAVGAPRDSEDLPAKAHVFWGWSDKIHDQNTSEDIYYRDPSIHFPSIQIDAKHLSDSGLLDSILRIPFVTRNHSGMWDCRLRSQQANLSRTISVFVISDKTNYCEGTEVRNNKGRYYWPRTIRGMEVRLPCNGDAASHMFATQKCNVDGAWVHLNTEMCPYISETTRILEQFAKVNLSIARGSVFESAKRLRNYTQSRENLSRLRDPIDFVFVAKTLNNYLEFLSQEKDLGSMLLDIVSQLLFLSPILSYRAEISNNSATDVAVAVEKAALHTQNSLTHKSNLAIEYFNFRPDAFTGITCTWYRSEEDREKRTFQCNTASHTIEMFRQHVDASIQVPSDFLELPLSQKLMVAVYQNANLFPCLANATDFKVTSPVIGVKLFSDSTTPAAFYNLSEPISIMLRAQPFHHEVSAPVPVRWDAEVNDWTSDGCQFLYYFHSLLVFSCSQLGYYGLMQNKKFLNDFPDENAGAQFRISPVGFYVGGLVLFLCTWINIVTYISSGNLIQMGRRQKHALVNSWLALSLLCLMFTIGIFQTEDYRVCQVFGISIHYFSLCVVLWVCVSVSNMYKRLSKRNRIPIDDIPKENVGRKPILGLYLVGYGIGLIICGISGAVNIREYASYSYCFLRSGPALSAIFVPATILLLFLSILFICVRCHIRMSSDHNGHLSEGTQGTENVDLELLEASPNGHHSERYRSLTLSSPTTSMQDDLEHTNGAQLRAHFMFLFLYSITWLSAAASISTPFKRTLLYEEELFSAIFAITSSLLGLFILFFYGISRSDVRRHWGSLSCRNICSPKCCRKRTVICDLKEQNTVTYHQTCSTMNSTSRSNSQCSKNRPPSASNQLKMHSELNSAATLPRNDSPSKLMTSPASVMLINRQQFVHNPVVISQDIPNADMFYNPNQINVARKFFKKQKRLAKRSNFELQRQIERGDFIDCGASDISSSAASSYPRATRGMSIFSSGSKVNNTNIHIKNLAAEIGQFSKDSRQQNINILSDSCNESDLIVDAERFVLGAAEGLRALNTRGKLNNASEMVANIYTNVPETSQPQHEIVTMRADDKFRKSAHANDFLEQDELDMERNDLNSRDSDRTSTPLYVNSNIRNIMDETVTSDEDVENIPLGSLDMKSNMGSQASEVSEHPNAAMNTVGLPINSDVVPQNISESMNESNEENMIELDRDAAYISEALEISDRVYKNGSDDASILIAPSIAAHPQRSKSMLSLDALTTKSKANKLSDSFHESQVRSISCTSLSEVGDEILGAIANPLPAKPIPEKRLLSSPVLFSPSLCEIDDIPSPDDRRKPISLINDDMSSNSGSLNLFNQSIRRNYVSSPTCESDLNYQNSELSIRSHGVYAPQPDNDLNITLTGEDNMFFPYQSSEISDIDDDENDFDDFNNCSNDSLLPPPDTATPDDDELMDDSHESIDELYQRITRRPNTGGMVLSSGGSIGDIDLRTMPISNCNAADETVEELEVSNENDDDSSQCSVISYIDPNGGSGAKE